MEVSGRTIVSIKGDENDPLSRGYLCPKAYGLKDLYEDPDRLRVPLVKQDGSWREADWEEAIDFAAEGLHRVQEAHGVNAVASYVGNPSVHNLTALLAGPAFIRALGSRLRFSASSIDQFPKMLSAYLVYGAQLAIPVPDLERTEYLIVQGANPVVSNGSLMTAPGMKKRIRDIQSRGGKVVVIDPRRTETAKLADEHLFLRPGADAPLLLAMLQVLFAHGRVELGAAEGRVEGLEHVREMCAQFSPETVAEATGVSAADIERIALEFADAPKAAYYGRIGTCVQSYGTLASYLIDVINIVTGRVDVEGGLMFPNPAAPLSSKGHYKKWYSRVRDIPEFGGELPVATLAEEIETPGEGQIRGLFTMAGNPVLSVPNGARLDAALDSLDFMVSVDPSLNETTRHADVILPPRHSLENPSYSAVLLQLAVRDVAKYSPPVFEPSEGSMSEWEILGGMVEKLGELRAQGEETDRATGMACAYFSADPQTVIASLLASGPYEVTMDDLLANPSGVDLGSLKAGGLDRGRRHDEGAIKLGHPEIDGEVSRLRDELTRGRIGEVSFAAGGSDPDASFVLIGRRQLRSNNSWMHNCPSLMTGGDRCSLLMNPADAGRLGVTGGSRVSVSSAVGQVDIPVELTDDMMPGVVSMPHGFGHTRPGVRMSLAQDFPGASMNDVTDDGPTEGLMGNGILTGVPVRVVASESP